MPANAAARLRDNDEGPTTKKLGDVMMQGSNGRHSSADDLPQLMNQGASTKRSGSQIKSMRGLLGQ